MKVVTVDHIYGYKTIKLLYRIYFYLPHCSMINAPLSCFLLQGLWQLINSSTINGHSGSLNIIAMSNFTAILH